MGSLHQTNGGAIEVPVCHYCSSPLEGQRAVANTPSGPKYFCRSDSEHPLDSCYRQYRRAVQLKRPFPVDERNVQLNSITSSASATEVAERQCTEK
jgi:hypothetical protein